ncbi:glucose 1-dehydrogenase-like [Plodia interpunctella]|uniref:glucose 1-dehydrogenase-like n=1 Tax=Plodia interpunctella TaxID=58824 RepID=UPI0023678206|nr:glucose 1-dehydrogenase-like [Plodia interpunctella]
MSFANKVVLITGGSSGIGATTAIFFAKEGANVAIVGRNQNKLKKVAEDCSKIGKTPLVIVAELNKDENIERIIKETIEKFKKLDVLVNNAGISVTGTITDGKVLEAYDAIMKVNVRSVIQLTVLATPYLIKTKGNIVNISSIAGKKVRSPAYMAYNVSKAALDHFTRGAALELSASGVRVNSVSPGPVKTDFFDNCAMPVTADSLGDIMALKRASDPDEIANLIVYLASDKARGITGSDFVCDNGGLL